MEGIKEVQRKTKKTRPPRGAARRSIPSSPTPIPLRSGSKRPDCIWRKASPGTDRPRNGRRRKHFVQVGEAVPRPGRSRLEVQAQTSEPSEAESCGGGTQTDSTSELGPRK